MASCPINMIDSNFTELWIAEEECPGVLPSTPVWYQQEPNSYSDLGGDVETAQRDYINPSRQKQKGAPVSQEAAGGFNTDVTASNMTRLLQGVFLADARQPVTTKPLNGTPPFAMTGVTDNSGDLQVAADAATNDFAVNDLVLQEGFGNPNNNGLALVTAISSGPDVMDTDNGGRAVAAETPGADAFVEKVGIQFASADASISYVSGVLSLVSAALDFTAITDLFPGMWVFVGGDGATNSFANNAPGYARIKSISGSAIVFDECTWTPVTDAGTGKAIQMFIPVTVKNENTPALIKKRTYHIERTLGLSEDDTVQAQYLEGAVPGELSVSIPTGDKVMADISFPAHREYEVTGLDTDLRLTGTRVDSLRQEAINTSTDIYRLRISLIDPDNITPNPEALFAYVQEANFSINNTVASQKAVGLLGALENTVGTFAVSGSVTAYLTTMAVKRAIRTLKDCSMNYIVAKNNKGIILDVPLVSLSGGKINVDKDAPVTIPISTSGSENSLGYTASYSEFKYLPDVAMPTVS